MSTERDTTRLVRSWLEEGVTALPDRVLDAVLDQLPATPQRRRFGPVRRSFEMHPSFKYALAAAAALVVAVAGFQLVPGLLGPGATPSPVPSPTAVAPVPTEMALPAGGPLAPGSYFMTSVPTVRITFTVPAAGWQKNVAPNAIWTANSEGRVGFGTVDILYVDPCATVLVPRDPAIGPTVDDLVAALSAMPGLDPGTVSDATVAGRPAKVVEITATVPQTDCGPDGYAVWDEVPLDHGRTRTFVLDVDGTRLVIQAVERPTLVPRQRDELQQILDSIAIAPS